MSQHENSTRTDTGPAASPPKLPATLHLGAVHLTVSNLEGSVAFYRDAIGLRLHRRERAVAAMGTTGGEDLLVLYEEPGVQAATPASVPLRAAVPLACGACARCAPSRRDANPDTGRL